MSNHINLFDDFMNEQQGSGCTVVSLGSKAKIKLIQ